MDIQNLFTIGRLCAWYTQDKPILSDFSIEFRKNEVIGLIGLNGAGKTTFIKTLSGLMNGFRVETAAWNGVPISFRNKAFKQNRYVVFADDHSFQYFTFHEYLTYAAASYGKPVPDVAKLVQGFHFAEYTNVLLKEMSTGNLKKVYLITAFALRPALLLLDEPVNGLDFQSTEYLYKLIAEYKQHGTILFSSHILESICLTSDRVLVLEHGKISRIFMGEEIKSETIREVLNDDANLKSIFQTALGRTL